MENTITHTEINGVSFSLIPIVPFEEWIESRYGNLDKFNTLSKKDKYKLFLRWKWGFTDERVNEELDSNEKEILYRFKDSDLNELSEVLKFHLNHKRQFDRICYDTKIKIGLIIKSNPLVDKLIDTFDAKEE